jgi:eukaryotic-like serine/threonine-protein kinase
MGSDHPDTLAIMHSLASMYLDQGNDEEGEIDQRVMGPEHPDTANAMTTRR